MLVNTNENIDSPSVNSVVFYTPRSNNIGRKKKPYPVIINSGQYNVNGRLSNFWYWQRISPTGRIKPEIEHGYGNFTVAEGYEIQRRVKVL